MRPTLAFILLAATLPLHAQTTPTAPDPVELEYPHLPKLLTPRVPIHADDEPDPPGAALTPIQRAMRFQNTIFGNMLSVSLDVVINENGRVESAHPTSGPERFFAQAQEIELHRAFAPARVDGNVVRARFTDYVSIYPKERWAAQPVPFPANPDLSTLSIGLQRTGCLGSCPSYTVTIAGSGEITFTGDAGGYIAVPGTHHARIPPEAVIDLLARFRSANFLSALPEYQCNWTDMASQTLTLTLNGSAKKVFDYGGSVVGLPDAIEALESAVDEAADTARWVTSNAETLPSLKAEQYNFASPSPDNVLFFNTALTSGNTDLIAAFLAAKAPITTPDPKLLSPICAATSTGNRDLVERLLNTSPQLKLPQPILDHCLSLSARSGKVPVVQLWLSRGARVNPPAPNSDSDNDINPPLFAAVQSGNPEVVDLLLHHHAKIASKANRGRSLLSFALAHVDNVDPQTMNRLITLLIQAGADPNEETEDDRPALYEVDFHIEAIPVLLQAGAKINKPDAEGKTALMWAYSPEAVKALLAAGADPTPTAPDGTTALKHAQSDNCKECATLIEAALRARTPAHQ